MSSKTTLVEFQKVIGQKPGDEQHLKGIFARLSRDESILVSLRYRSGQTVGDIAGTLGFSIAQVEERLGSAIGKIQSGLTAARESIVVPPVNDNKPKSVSKKAKKAKKKTANRSPELKAESVAAKSGADGATDGRKCRKSRRVEGWNPFLSKRIENMLGWDYHL